MDWSKISMRRRRFLRLLGVSAITIGGGRLIGKGVEAVAQETVENTYEKSTSLMPTIYLPHGGGPCFFMDWEPRRTWDGMGAWLKQLGSAIGVKPKALVVISAHWEEPEITINIAEKPELFYDYYGFPEETYKIQYPAPGAPQLGERVAALLKEAGISSRFTKERGLDHGVFIPLKLVYPEADIPIVQVSLKVGLDPAWHLDLGKALAALRKEGVLIVGSGMSYHNLSKFGSGGGVEASIAFDNWLAKACQSEPAARSKLLSQWEKAPSARAAHPREEHLIPLMVTVGAALDEPARQVYSDRVMGLAISGFQFGSALL